jgi:hypothetical protein
VGLVTEYGEHDVAASSDQADQGGDVFLALLASIHRQRCVTLALLQWIPFVASVIRRLDIEIGVHLIDAQIRKVHARFGCRSCRMPALSGRGLQLLPARPI